MVPILPGCRSKMLLLGDTGSGKTWLCNRIEGTYVSPEGIGVCGKEGNRSTSETSKLFIGKYVIDSAGFGDNRKRASSRDRVGSTLGVINNTLTSLRGIPISSIGLVVKCVDRMTDELIESFRLLESLLGVSVPVYLIINKLVKDGTTFCTIEDSSQMNLLETKSIPIASILFKEDVISKVTDGVVPIIPPDEELSSILKGRDITHLILALESYRKLRCDKISQLLEELIKPTCPDDPPSPPVPTPPPFPDCMEQTCVKKEKKCDLVFWFCYYVCTKYETHTNDGCVKANAIRDRNYKIAMEVYKREVDERLEVLKVNRERCIKSHSEYMQEKRRLLNIQKECDELLTRGSYSRQIDFDHDEL
jgi:GTPase SAR1 family protein